MKGKVYWRWGLTAFLTVCAILVFYDAFYQGGTLQHILGKLAEVLAPVFYGLAMAYLLTPLVIAQMIDRGIGVHDVNAVVRAGHPVVHRQM